MKVILIVCLVTNFVFAKDEVWFKFGPEKQPRYALKNDILPLCGIFESVTAEQIEFKSERDRESLSIGSCLESRDSIDHVSPAMFKILDLKNGKLKIQLSVEEDTKKPVLAKLIYLVNANGVATPWASRYPEGDVLSSNTDLCETMASFRDFNTDDVSDSAAKQNEVLPFKPTKKKELIRYHVFEYHLGCGT